MTDGKAAKATALNQKEYLMKYAKEHGFPNPNSMTESNSITAQRNLIESYIRSREEWGGCPVMEYVDDGWSGTNFVEVR